MKKMFLAIIVSLFTTIITAQTVKTDSISNIEIEKYNQKNKQVFDDFKEFVKEKGNYLGDSLYVINEAKYTIIVWPRKTISITVREDEKTLEIYMCALDYGGNGLNVYSGDELSLNRDGLLSPLEKTYAYINELKTIMYNAKWKLY